MRTLAVECNRRTLCLVLLVGTGTVTVLLYLDSQIFFCFSFFFFFFLLAIKRNSCETSALNKRKREGCTAVHANVLANSLLYF